MELPNKKYNVIYADPPWNFSSKYGGDMKNINEHYSVMSMEKIKNMNINSITKENCLLFMWCPDAHIKEGISVIERWGFQYKTIAFNWVKHTKKGNIFCNVAPYTMKSWELCLLGTKGKCTQLLKKRNLKGLVNDIRKGHSRKPSEVRKRIKKMVGNKPKIELFARENLEGWDVWGNEVGKFDEEFNEKKKMNLFEVKQK